MSELLCHHGVKGQKWGVHRSKEELKNDANAISSVVNRRLKNSAGTAKHITYHAFERMDTRDDRKVTADDIIDAINRPLRVTDVKIDKLGRPSVRYIGDRATIAVNPDTGEIPTVWITGSKARKKYGGNTSDQ